MIALPHRRWVVATLGAGAALAAATPDLRYLRRLQATSQQVREQIAHELADDYRLEHPERVA